MVLRTDLKLGMPVYSADGERLGRVVAIGTDDFQIEKGLVFTREVTARMADVRELREGAVFLSQLRASLLAAGEEYKHGPSAGADALGALGHARVERYHDVIGAAPPGPAVNPLTRPQDEGAGPRPPAAAPPPAATEGTFVERRASEEATGARRGSSEPGEPSRH